MTTKLLTTLLSASILTASPAVSAEPAALDLPEKAGPRVQLALLLDTSGSMDGLIDQARSQIWQVVNTFITAKQGGQTPIVEVALYEYGNSNLSETTHFIRQLQPLTRDLDAVSESLFSLRTSGGLEYCGAVIQRATQDLAWDPAPDTYKAIFIAGNEPFTQGPISANDVCRDAISRGIIVNTIHCGDEAEGARTGWKDGARLADGHYLVIDHNQAVISIDAPQDAEIAKLNDSLNKTYIAYGKQGATRRERQLAQDGLVAASAASAQAQRAATKASANYMNADWDLVDAIRENKVELGAIATEDLPAELRELPSQELGQVVERKSEERTQIQSQILKLSKEREAFIAAEKQKAAATDQGDTLDSAMITAVREQAEKKGIVFNP